MKNKVIITFARLFIVPIGSTFSFYLTGNIHSFKKGFIFFSLTFFLNWIADKIIVTRLIKRGNKLTKKHSNK